MKSKRIKLSKQKKPTVKNNRVSFPGMAQVRVSEDHKHLIRKFAAEKRTTMVDAANEIVSAGIKTLTQ